MRESDIRQAVLSNLGREYENDPDAFIIEELGLCQGEARIDIAVLNGLIHGFEIKSDQDTLKRLPVQAEIYNRTLDSITLVVGSKHLNNALKLVPQWWGVVVVKEKSGRIHQIIKEKGKSNPNLDPFAVAQLLWRDEAFEALKQRGLHRGLANKPRAILWAKLAEQLSVDELGAVVRNILKSRENWRSAYKRA